MVLITGANGQLGTDFQKLFQRIEIDYIAASHAELDIANQNAIENFLKGKNIDYIINCAAYNNVDKAEEEPEKCQILNGIAPRNLALAAKKIGVVYITYSTDFVFDGEKRRPYTEEDIPNPLCAYAKSKLEGEKNVLEAYDRSFVIRTSWLFGIGQNNFNNQIIAWSKSKGELGIVDDQVSSPTYSKDLAEYSWALIKSNKFGLYHLSNGGLASKYDQAKYLLDKIGWEGRLVRAKTADFNLLAKRPGYSKLSSEKAEKIIGKKMPHWKEAIDRFLKEAGYQI